MVYQFVNVCVISVEACLEPPLLKMHWLHWNSAPYENLSIFLLPDLIKSEVWGFWKNEEDETHIFDDIYTCVLLIHQLFWCQFSYNALSPMAYSESSARPVANDRAVNDERPRGHLSFSLGWKNKNCLSAKKYKRNDERFSKRSQHTFPYPCFCGKTVESGQNSPKTS